MSISNMKKYSGAGLSMLIRGHKPYFQFFSNDLHGKNEITSRRWTHLAFVYDGHERTQKIYMNGVNDPASPRKAKNPLKGDSRLCLGMHSGARYLNGKMCGIRLWTEARRLDQVRDGMYTYYDPSTTPNLNLLVDPLTRESLDDDDT